jgi:nitrogen fixation protein NifU and related proteins
MTDLQLSSLYQQLILEHYRTPRNRGQLSDATVSVHMRNPSCGDEIRLQLRVESDRIVAVRFEGEGCSISQASVSMMTGLLVDRPLDEALALANRFTQMMHGDEEAAADRALKDLRVLKGVAKFPVRIKCALLGFDALQEAVRETRKGTPEGGQAGETGPG